MNPPNDRFLRQLDIVSPERLAFPITVIGAGAIGSATALTLAKMGCTDITVWDDDVLAEHNVPNRICKPSAVGQPKGEALAELAFELTEVRIQGRNERYRGQRLHGVVIAATDNMAGRQDIWQRVKLDTAVPILIDGRMGAEFGRIYAIRPCDAEDIDFYELNLYPSSDAERLPCSARSIIYCPAVMAGVVAVLVKQHAVSDQLPPEVLLDLAGLRVSVTWKAGSTAEASRL